MNKLEEGEREVTYSKMVFAFGRSFFYKRSHYPSSATITPYYKSGAYIDTHNITESWGEPQRREGVNYLWHC